MRDGITDPENFLSATLDLRRLKADNPPDTEGGYFAWCLPTAEDIGSLLKNRLEFDTLIFVSPRAPETQEIKDSRQLAKKECVMLLTTLLRKLHTAQPDKLKKIGIIGPWGRPETDLIASEQRELLESGFDWDTSNFFIDDQEPTEQTMTNLWEKLCG